MCHSQQHCVLQKEKKTHAKSWKDKEEFGRISRKFFSAGNVSPCLLENCRNKSEHMRSLARGEIFSKSLQIKPKSGCIYHASIDFDSNRRLFGSDSLGNS